MTISQHKVVEKKKNVHNQKYLTFSIGDERYGVPVLRIREIVKAVDYNIIRIPNTPSHALGILQLRDKIFSIFDSKQLFGMGKTEINDNTCVIIIEIQKLNMLKCWEELNCKEEKCPTFMNNTLKCWSINGTLCKKTVQGTAFEKFEECQKCKLLIHSQNNKSVQEIGLLVEAVNDVREFLVSEIYDPPSFNERGQDEITGIGRKEINGNNEVTIILNVDNIVDI